MITTVPFHRPLFSTASLGQQLGAPVFFLFFFTVPFASQPPRRGSRGAPAHPTRQEGKFGEQAKSLRLEPLYVYLCIKSAPWRASKRFQSCFSPATYVAYAGWWLCRGWWNSSISFCPFYCSIDRWLLNAGGPRLVERLLSRQLPATTAWFLASEMALSGLSSEARAKKRKQMRTTISKRMDAASSGYIKVTKGYERYLSQMRGGGQQRAVHSNLSLC